MKKGFIIIAMCLIALLCTGCSVTPYENVQTTANATVYDVQIELVLHPDKLLFLQEACDTYTKIHPNVTFTITTLPDDSNYHGALTKALNQQDPPEAFMVDGLNDITFFKEHLAPISRPTFAEGVENVLTPPVSLGDVLYALPMNLNAYGIIYNTQLLASLNLNTKNLSSMDELCATVSTMMQQMNNTGFKTAVCCKTDLADIALTNALNHADKATDPALSPNLSTLLKLCGNGSLDDPAALIAKRQAGMYFGGSDLLSMILQIDPTAENVLSIAPLPLEENNSSLVVNADYLAINCNASEVEKETLQDFLQWLYQSDEGKAVLEKNTVLSPYSNQRLPRLQQNILQSCKEGKVQTSRLGEAPNGFKEEVFFRQIEQYRTGKTDWESCTAQIKSRWESCNPSP